MTENKKNFSAASFDLASPFRSAVMMIAGMLISSIAMKSETRSRALDITTPPSNEDSIKK